MKFKGNISSHQRSQADLILNKDGTVYHLGIGKDDLADDIILVGDPDRVERIGKRFDKIELQRSNREFKTLTGSLKGKRISVISTGIGVDNADIVLNEIDVAANFDIEDRRPRESRRQLRFYRLGTSGCMQEGIPVDSYVSSAYAIGMDGVPWWYGAEMEDDEKELQGTLLNGVNWPKQAAEPYVVKSDAGLLQVANFARQGITLTANGFYAPQQREVVLPLVSPGLFIELQKVGFRGLKMTNFEMECAGIYALASMLGHRATTVCAILANRAEGTFSNDPATAVNELIDRLLGGLTR